MSSIIKYIDGYMNGNRWEELCVRCYRLRYQKDGYTPIPASYCGDAGIEGFTSKGVVHQCYCPERVYTDDELYYHQRDKMTADIEKLLNNGERLKKLGVPPIIEWHFNIPEYKDARILEHAEKKRKEVAESKKNDSIKYSYIANDFRIIVKTVDDFAVEISQIIRTNLTDMKLNLSIESSDSLDWSKCDSKKVANVRRKIKAVMLVDDSDEALKRVVDTYMNCYINGIDIMNKIHTDFPEMYESIYRLEQNYKREVSIKTLMNTNKAMNSSIFESILAEFQRKLERDFTPMLDSASITELKHDLVASWLADCSMEFRSD